MKGTIEITIRTVEDGRMLTSVKGRNCTDADVLGMMTEALCALAARSMDVPEEYKKQCADEFGRMMGGMLLDVMNGKGRAQRFDGREAEFLAELLKRQGEVQEG